MMLPVFMELRTETAANNAGVNLSKALPAAVGGKALWRFSAPVTTGGTAVQQQTAGTATYGWANTVRGTQAARYPIRRSCSASTRARFQEAPD